MINYIINNLIFIYTLPDKLWLVHNFVLIYSY